MADQLPPLVAIHMTAAALALVIGPIAIWARLGRRARPTLHRAFGYAWTTLMILAAISALFIRSTSQFSFAGFSPIHLLIPFTLGNLTLAFRALMQGDYKAHRAHMVGTYIGGCLIAGVFTLLPGRLIGDWLWRTIG